LLRNNHFQTREQARHAVAAWIDDYNSQRRHSTNGMLSPIDYEHACTQRRRQAPANEHHNKGAA
jgi:putative transposase